MTDIVEQLSFIQLVGVCGIVLAVLIALAVGIGFALERWLASSRRIFNLPRAEGQLRWELLGNLRFVAMAAFAFAGVLWWVPRAEESLASGVVTIVFCWLGFEVYYWGLHRLMHVRRFYRFHRYHHESRVTSPLTGYSMSGVESLGWLVGLAGAPLLLSLATPVSLVGLLAYHALYQIPGNVIGHANVDFFPAAAARRRNSWISHPTLYHSLHHARFNNHYSFGSSFMDRLLGTEWADWPELHARVLRGEPLAKLAERGSLGPVRDRAA
jgi:sterol desaturase/sphingolipid hydroxylase (fatty acid hydroxylase superfamily)